MSDIDTVLVDSLKALDPKRPIREADMRAITSMRPLCAKLRHHGRMGVLKSDDTQNGTAFRFEAKRGHDPVSGSRASTEVRGSHQLCLAHSFDHLIGESQQLDRFECRDFFRR